MAVFRVLSDACGVSEAPPRTVRASNRGAPAMAGADKLALRDLRKGATGAATELIAGILRPLAIPGQGPSWCFAAPPDFTIDQPLDGRRGGGGLNDVGEGAADRIRGRHDRGQRVAIPVRRSHTVMARVNSFDRFMNGPPSNCAVLSRARQKEGTSEMGALFVWPARGALKTGPKSRSALNAQSSAETVPSAKPECRKVAVMRV